MAIANQVCKSLSVIPLRTLLELFPSQPLLTTFPELDPYPSRNKGIYLGSIHGVGQAADIRWPTEAERKAMVYLRPAHQCCIPVLSALTESGITAICAIPGINEAQIKKYESPLLKVVAHPVEFSELGRQSGLTLCHGGAGTIAQSLLAGVPLLLIPTTVEQYLNAKRVESLGAGILLEPGTDKKGVSVAMEHILTNPQYRKSAKEFALRHLADTPEDSAERAANAILNKDLGIAVGQEVDRGHSSYTGMKRDALH
ncbi:hypothetical protein B9N43_00530 [Denitratisoma sp. DHT3]|nr:hypothetical protein B9N43_00530 [Denitratisoma sp. DHT3]